MQKKVIVVIPNWNGAEDLAGCIDSILAQSYRNLTLVVVDNGSTDNSKQIIIDYGKRDERVRGIYLDKNYGYTGGVNPGMELAIKEGAAYVAPFNNDAIADRDWLKHLVNFLETHPAYGIAACSLLHADGKTYDSTADTYTSWGIPYPRGRDEPVSNRYDDQRDIFGASGGASLYRTAMLATIGTFDQDFFAYYEDIDLSFRAQLAGYKVSFVPESRVYHEQGKTAAKMVSGFTTQQYMKNLPLIIIKDLPLPLWWRVIPRFCLAYSIFFVNAFVRGRGWPALNGWLTVWKLLPAKLRARHHIQKSRTVSIDYVWSLFTHDLPPNARKLRKLRSFWWKLTGRRSRQTPSTSA